jgi:ABC-type transport system substrate-binding protein
MRAAFNYAWNQSDFIANSLNGLGVQHEGLVLQGQLGFQSNYKFPYPFNLTIAGQDITSACKTLGCSPTNPIQITIDGTNDPVSDAAAAILAANINSLADGVTVTYAAAPYPTALSVFLAQTEGIYLAENGANPVDPLVSPLYFYGDGAQFGAGHMGYNDSAVNSLISQALGTPDNTQRAQLYSQANALIAQDGNFVPIAQLSSVIVTSNTVKVVNYASLISAYLPNIVELAPA